LILNCKTWAPAAVFSLALLSASAQTNALPSPGALEPARPHDQLAEQTRAECVAGRRFICGKVMQITRAGLVVDSGYTRLLEPPFDKSWLVRGTASLKPALHAVEAASPGTPCIGLVFLTDFPKRPAVKLYDYVVIQAYPAGTYVYSPVPTVQKTLRRFAAGLPTAVKLNLQASEK
jgi:hypothetical protein